jgi:uncharacterized protein (TIGR03437 family)
MRTGAGGEERNFRRGYHRRQARRRADSLGHRLRSHHSAGRRRHSGARRTRQYNASAVTIKIGTADAQVFGAALSPGFAGLYQVAIQVPAPMADGDYALKATVSGAVSPDGVILSVKK